MTGDTDRLLMAEAIVLARAALGTTAPNPAVGCVIAVGDRIIGRGATQPGGRPHAEVVALSEAGEAARGASAYVTLEPCAHHGRTPPCADALIAAGVARVVVAHAHDPDPRVQGRGIARLRAAGIVVETGLMAEQAAAILAGFAKTVTQGLPWVTLKLGVTLDGCIATKDGESRWITGPAARGVVQQMRAEHDGILVGIGTVLADDPSLRCGLPGLGDRPRWRVVADSLLRTPLRSQVVQHAKTHALILLASPDAAAERARLLQEAGVTILHCDREPSGRIDLVSASAALERDRADLHTQRGRQPAGGRPAEGRPRGSAGLAPRPAAARRRGAAGGSGPRHRKAGRRNSPATFVAAGVCRGRAGNV